MELKKAIRNFFDKGLSRDIDKHRPQNQTYYWNENFRLMTQEGNSNFVLENVLGNEKMLDTEGNEIKFDLQYKIIGNYVFDNNDIVLFGISRTFYPNNGFPLESKIYLLKYAGNDKYYPLITLYHDIENYRKGRMRLKDYVEIKGYTENNYVRKIYWTDDINPLRFLNIAPDIDSNTNEPYDGTQQSHYISIQNRHPLTFDNIGLFQPINIEKQLVDGGELFTGQIKYAVRFYTKYGQFSNFYIDNDYINIYDENSLSLQDNVNIRTQKAVKLTLRLSYINYLKNILNIDPNYTHIEVWGIYYGKNQGTPDIKKITDVELTKENNDYYTKYDIIDNGYNYIDNISQEEIALIYEDLIPYCIEVKDNRLFAGNNKSKDFIVNFDARAYRFKYTGSQFISDLYSDENTIEETIQVNEGDSINWSNIQINETDNCLNLYNTYRYENNLDTNYKYAYLPYKINNELVYGAEGENVKVTFTYVHKTETDKFNTFQTDEIYRLGVVFFDIKGNSSFVKWIGDIKTPTMRDILIAKQSDPSINHFNIHIDIKNIPIGESIREKPIYAQIVAVPRRKKDRTVIATGLANRTSRIPNALKMSESDDTDSEDKKKSKWYCIDENTIIAGLNNWVEYFSHGEDTSIHNLCSPFIHLRQRNILEVISPDLDYNDLQLSSNIYIKTNQIGNFKQKSAPGYPNTFDIWELTDMILYRDGLGYNDFYLGPTWGTDPNFLLEYSKYEIKDVIGLEPSSIPLNKYIHAKTFPDYKSGSPTLLKGGFKKSDPNNSCSQDTVCSESASDTGANHIPFTTPYRYLLDDNFSSGKEVYFMPICINNLGYASDGEMLLRNKVFDKLHLSQTLTNISRAISPHIFYIREEYVSNNDFLYPDYIYIKRNIYPYGGYTYNDRLNNDYIPVSQMQLITEMPTDPGYGYAMFDIKGFDTYYGFYSRMRYSISKAYNDQSGALELDFKERSVMDTTEYVYYKRGSSDLEHNAYVQTLGWSEFIWFNIESSVVLPLINGIQHKKYNLFKQQYETDTNRKIRFVEEKDNKKILREELLTSKKVDSSGEDKGKQYIIKEEIIDYNDMFLYNAVYSNISLIKTYYHKPLFFEKNISKTRELYYSDVKQTGEIKDSFMLFRPNNVITLDSKYGEIKQLINFKNYMFAFQERGMCLLPINERALTQGTTGSAIVLGEGAVISKHFNYVNGSEKYGLQKDNKALKTIDNIYWIDIIEKKILQFNGKTNELNIIKGLSQWLDINIDENTSYVIGYDNRYKEVLFSMDNSDIHNDKFKKTLVFSEVINAFQGIYTFKTYSFVNSNLLFSVYDAFDEFHTPYLYLHNVGKRGSFYDSIYNSVLEIIVNDNTMTTKEFNNIEYMSESYITNEENLSYQDDYYDTFDYIKARNDFLQTERIHLIPYMPGDILYTGGLNIPVTAPSNVKNIRRRERIWRTTIPRVDSGNDSVDNYRMRDAYVKIKLEYKNNKKERPNAFIIHPITTYYTLSNLE